MSKTNHIFIFSAKLSLTSALCGFEDICLEGEVTRVADVLGLELRKLLQEEVSLCTRPHSGQDVAACLQCHRDGCLSHSTAPRVHQHPVTSPDPSPHHQCIVGSGIHHWHCGCLLKTPALGHWPQKLCIGIHSGGKALEAVDKMCLRCLIKYQARELDTQEEKKKKNLFAYAFIHVR